MSSEAKWTYPARLRVAAEAPAVRAVLYQGLLLDAAAAYERLEAALAVAREREQRAMQALAGIAGRKHAPASALREYARAALVDEPAAAATRKCPNCNGVGKVRDSMRVDPVTCGRCGGRGFIPAAATLAESAAADEPGETPA